MKLTADDIERAWMVADPLNFVAAFHKEMYGDKFIVGKHHRVIADTIAKIVSGELSHVIINIAPRYSKTELVSIGLAAYGFAINPRCNFIETSYSADLTAKNSLAVKRIMKSDRFQRLFQARIGGVDTQTEWQTEQGGGLFATSSLGQLTGFGAGSKSDADEKGNYKFSGAVIIDDPLKPVDALSDTKREAVNQWFYNTLRSRVNSRNTPIVIIMQRLHEDDLCGFLQRKEPGVWHVVSMPCIYTEDGEEKALWPHTHTLGELYAMRDADAFTFETQYMQNPKPIEGLMYTNYREYEKIPQSTGGKMKAYIDTADTGSDYLCAIVYYESVEGNYLVDVLFTQKAMEYTEPATAEMLSKHKVDECVIESNNGGRGFARNVERNCRALGNNHTQFKWFHQTENKQVRIFTKSNEVQNLTFYPAGWERMWPEFSLSVRNYLKSGRNAHDDAVDALTGTIEWRAKKRTVELSSLFY